MNSDFSTPSTVFAPQAEDLSSGPLHFSPAVDLIELGLCEDIDWEAEGERVLKMLADRSEPLPPWAA